MQTDSEARLSLQSANVRVLRTRPDAALTTHKTRVVQRSMASTAAVSIKSRPVLTTSLNFNKTLANSQVNKSSGKSALTIRPALRMVTASESNVGKDQKGLISLECDPPHPSRSLNSYDFSANLLSEPSPLSVTGKADIVESESNGNPLTDNSMPFRENQEVTNEAIEEIGFESFDDLEGKEQTDDEDETESIEDDLDATLMQALSKLNAGSYTKEQRVDLTKRTAQKNSLTNSSRSVFASNETYKAMEDDSCKALNADSDIKQSAAEECASDIGERSDSANKFTEDEALRKNSVVNSELNETKDFGNIESNKSIDNGVCVPESNEDSESPQLQKGFIDEETLQSKPDVQIEMLLSSNPDSSAYNKRTSKALERLAWLLRAQGSSSSFENSSNEFNSPNFSEQAGNAEADPKFVRPRLLNMKRLSSFSRPKKYTEVSQTQPMKEQSVISQGVSKEQLASAEGEESNAPCDKPGIEKFLLDPALNIRENSYEANVNTHRGKNLETNLVEDTCSQCINNEDSDGFSFAGGCTVNTQHLPYVAFGQSNDYDEHAQKNVQPLATLTFTSINKTGTIEGCDITERCETSNENNEDMRDTVDDEEFVTSIPKKSQVNLKGESVKSSVSLWKLAVKSRNEAISNMNQQRLQKRESQEFTIVSQDTIRRPASTPHLFETRTFRTQNQNQNNRDGLDMIFKGKELAPAIEPTHTHANNLLCVTEVDNASSLSIQDASTLPQMEYLATDHLKSMKHYISEVMSKSFSKKTELDMSVTQSQNGQSSTNTQTPLRKRDSIAEMFVDFLRKSDIASGINSGSSTIARAEEEKIKHHETIDLDNLEDIINVFNSSNLPHLKVPQTSREYLIHVVKKNELAAESKEERVYMSAHSTIENHNNESQRTYLNRRFVDLLDERTQQRISLESEFLGFEDDDAQILSTLDLAETVFKS